MVPAPTYQNLPTFGTGASLVQPIAGTYNGGFLPGQLFPAEYENWLMNYITSNSNASQTAVVNLVAEMGTILAAASITPNAGQTNQVYAALNALYATVGSLSSESTNRVLADNALQTNIGIAVKALIISNTGSFNLPELSIGQTSALYIVALNATITLKTPITLGLYSYFFQEMTNLSTFAPHSNTQDPGNNTILSISTAPSHYFLMITRRS